LQDNIPMVGIVGEMRYRKEVIKWENINAQNVVVIIVNQEMGMKKGLKKLLVKNVRMYG
jgi:hypothetical protein